LAFIQKKDAMKKITLTLFCLAATLILACTNDPKPTKEPSKTVVPTKDSTTTAAFSAADENKVIGNINFGIDKKQFDKAQAAFMASLDHSEFQTTYAIGGYLFSSLTGQFDANQLKEVNTTGDFIHQQRYEAELLPQVDILKDLVAKKYGEPQEGSGAPNYQDIKKDQSHMAYRWTIGSKVISINVVNRGDYSSCDLKIIKK
jgi:hypothetical protein